MIGVPDPKGVPAVSSNGMMLLPSLACGRSYATALAYLAELNDLCGRGGGVLDGTMRRDRTGVTWCGEGDAFGILDIVEDCWLVSCEVSWGIFSFAQSPYNHFSMTNESCGSVCCVGKLTLSVRSRSAATTRIESHIHLVRRVHESFNSPGQSAQRAQGLANH